MPLLGWKVRCAHQTFWMKIQSTAQTHRGHPVFLVLFRKDPARMNGAPQPNQKRLQALGMEPGSINLKPHPLTIEPFLTPETVY